ncbi:hypothetical protein [Polaribacter atrinae]|uniref:hypothetical protein n=1 Tax=Polaribacter atrinae TaxID=1333662 RepID=UPI0030F50862
MDLLKTILEFELFSVGAYSLKVSTLFMVLLIFIITKVVLWLLKKSLFRIKGADEFSEGNIYSLFQIIKYVV